MSLSFRSAASVAVTSSATMTCNIPAGTLPGDLLIAATNLDGGSSTPWTAPSGWTAYTTPSGDRAATFYTKIAGLSEPSSYTFTYGSSIHGVMIIAAYSGYGALDAYSGYGTPIVIGGGAGTLPINSGSITTTQDNEKIVCLWIGEGDAPIVIPGGQTSRATAASSGTYMAVSDYVGPSTPGPSAPGSGSIHYPSGGTYGAWEITVSLKILVPLSPTLIDPTDGSYDDLAAFHGPFSWAYNPASAFTSETGYSFRRKVSGGSYEYWNAGSSSFQSTDLVNTSTATTITPSPWTDGLVYNWSAASTDAAGTGPYASDFTVNSQVAPSVSVTGPTGTIATQLPTVTWTDTLAAGGSQATYQVITYNSTQYTYGGFTPGVGPNCDDSGVIASSATNYTVATALPNQTSYRSYVQITQSPGGQASAWAYTAFTVAVDAPRPPTIVATYDTIPANLLSADDSSFEGGLGTTGGGVNVVVSQSSAESESGTYSLAMESVASGEMWCGTAGFTGGYPVLPNTTYTVRSDYRAATNTRTVRTDISWFDSTGTFISRSEGNPVVDTTSGWTTSEEVVASPVNAVFGQILYFVLATGAGGEVHYVDEAGIFPGLASEWTVGTFNGANQTPSIGCPRVRLDVTFQDNILSADDSSFDGGLGTTTAFTNCSVAQSPAESEDGAYSCAMTSTAAGDMNATTATGLSGYAVLPNTAYTFRADFRADSSPRTVNVNIFWYDSSGAGISDVGTPSVTDSTSGWTTTSATVVSPANAAFASLLYYVVGTGAGGETHYVDEAGIFPGTVSTWTLGGFVGTTSVQILRSDGLYVRGASVANPAPVPVPSQIVTIADYEATPGNSYTYTATTIAGPLSSEPSTPSAAVMVPTGLGFWELDPTNYTSAVNAQPVAWNVQNFEQSASHAVISQTTVNVVASAMQVNDMASTYKLFNAALYLGFFALTNSQKTIFFSDPFGFSYYFRLAPAPGGLSGGLGNKAQDTQLQASTAAGPFRIVAVTGAGQPRPQV